MSARLSLERVERAFGGVRAVDGASFEVAPGAVHGLIGPNGAGKTTIINLVSGLLEPTAGALRFEGRAHRRGSPPHRIAALGIARTFQNIRLFPELSARDNVIVGEHLRRARVARGAAPRAALVARRGAARRGSAPEALLERVGLHERRARSGEAPLLRRAAPGRDRPRPRRRAELLLLDEPTAGMNPVEVEAVAALIGKVAAEGHSVLLVEHNVRLVMDVCHRITVLNFGKVIAEGAPAQVAEDPAVITAYLGGPR